MLRTLVSEDARAAGVARAERDAEAFSRLATQQLDDAYQLAGYLLGNATDAQDAVQDAVARAWGAFRTLRDRELFDRWFRRIVVNGCRDRLRRHRGIRLVAIDDEDERLVAIDPFASSLARDELGRALEVLGPEERTVIVLHYWKDMSTGEIATLLGIPQGTVKYRLHSAYGRLRRRLESASREAAR